MKLNYISLLVMAFLTVSCLTSCQKYLDIVENGNAAIIKSAGDCQALLDDYGTMNSNYPYDMLISSDDYFIAQKDYGNVSYDIETAGLSRWDANAIRLLADQPWTSSYKRVFQANLVIEEVGKLRKEGSTDASVLDGLEGAALFYRAYNFWLLAQMYALPYSSLTAATAAGIPLRFTSDLNEVTLRATVKTTYEQIISDLQKSVSLLPGSVTVPSRPGKAAGYAMLARCYLSMSDYPNALVSSTAALALKNTLLDFNDLTPTGSNGRYITARFNTEVLFQALAYEDYYGFFSNSRVSISQELAAQYAGNDLRSKVFFKDLNNDTFLKFIGSYDGSTTLFIGLATDELYLTRAECYARAGNTGAAMSDLNTLLVKRFAAPYINQTANSADDALNKILAERRKELVLRGLRWTDLRRLNLETKTAVTVTRVLNSVTYTLPPNDLRYTLLIPQEVINNSSLTQNAR